MARYLTVGAAQMGPVSRDETRPAVVDRLINLMREAKGRGCELVVFTECALTPFFPRWWEDDPSTLDCWFERELPGPDTKPLFDVARELEIGFQLGYAELAEEEGITRHYNTSVLVGPDGKLIGKYRKIHLPGATTQDEDNPHLCYERRYFDVGNLDIGAWKAFGGVVGMCLGNDRRWPETYRVLGLQGAELITVGYNTVADHPNFPVLDHLTDFHSRQPMQAGAYQNGCFVVGVAKAGHEEGFNQLGRSAIISPSGEVVTQCNTLEDEVAVHRCDLDQTKLYKEQIFDFAKSRVVSAYSLITSTQGPISPREPGDFAAASTEVTPDKTAAPETPAEAVEILLKDQYGYANEKAKDFAERARLAWDHSRSETEEAAPSQKTEPQKPADPIEAIRVLFREQYGYPAEQIEPFAAQAEKALEHVKSQEEDAPAPKKPAAKPSSKAAEILAKAGKKPAPPSKQNKPETEVAPPPQLPIAEDIGWLPGRFALPQEASEVSQAVVERLMRDYRYSESFAKQIAEQAMAAWKHAEETEGPKPAPLAPAAESPDEPAATQVYVPGEHPELENLEIPAPGQPLTDGNSSKANTVPTLSSEDALAVYSIFTSQYGYGSRTARGIAERANSAYRRWNTAQAENAPKKKPPETTLTPPPQPKSEEPTAATQAPEEPKFLVFPCPECDFELKLHADNVSLLGRKARCPQCQTKFLLPESV